MPELNFPACPRCKADKDGQWRGPSYVEVGRIFICAECGYPILWLDANNGDRSRIVRDLPRWSDRT